MLALFGLSFFHLGRGAMEHKGTLSTTTPNLTTKADGLYVPGIGVVLTSIVNADCTEIDFQLLIRNTSTNNESLTLSSVVDINDPLFVANLNPIAGDVGNDGIMGPGESWIITATRSLSPDDLLQDWIQNQATVTADVVGQPGISAIDLSHFDNPNLDDFTRTYLISCHPTIGVILKAKANDFFGNSPGCTYVGYDISVANTDANGTAFNNISIDLGPNVTIGDLQSGDDNSNDQLDTNEIWVYTATRNIQPADIDDDKLVDQADVQANVVGTPGFTVNDLSHFDNFDLDEVTTTDLTHCANGIALIKQPGITVGPIGDGDGCTSIKYTYLIFNMGSTELTGLTLEDTLDGTIPVNPIEGDFVPLGVLDPGETWEVEYSHTITVDDIQQSMIESQAYVEAITAIEPGVIYSDVSDHSDFTLDRPTVTDIGGCHPRISLIKTGVAKDGQGLEDGCVFIDYTFSVTNHSDKLILENVTISELDLPVIVPVDPDLGDDVNPGQLDPGETWIYTSVEYQLTTADRIAKEVTNSAVVNATVQDFPGMTIEDYSDYESIDEDRPTVTVLPDCEPRIGLVKTGIVNADCSAIDYTFTVTIESDFNESFENVKLTDLDLPLDIQGPQGDGGLLGVLEPGETWTYTAKQSITPDDINFGCFHNQAQVTANVLAFPDLMVEDLSDDNSPDEDDVTEVDLSSCQNPAVGLIKQAELLDINNDGCPESVVYTFTLENTGDADLHEAVLNDDMLNGEVPGPTPESDDGGDGILSVGEIWTYQAVYNIVQADIDNTYVQNTATVTLSNLCATAQAADTSDDNSNTEDDPTQIEIPADACTDGNASIGLIKTGIIQDVNQDNCPESILYTFTVANNGDVGLDTVELMDDTLGGAIPGPMPGTDENEDGVLSPNETWTYEFLYDLVQEDIDAGSKENQATVSAEPLGLDVKITDDSDDNSLLENDITSTTVPNNACTTGSASLGLTKMGALTDVNQDGCFESILYTFVVINNGEVDLDTVEITDNVLGATLNEPLPGEDDGNDGILSVGESWTYQVLYAILDTDINNTYVQNTAQATAELVNTAIGVQDTSHPSDPLSDGPTITDVPANACTNGSAGIGLIKKGDLADAKGDGCTDSITYTFTVTNTGEVDLEELLLEDEKLGGYIAGPVPGTDDGNDGILSIGESWTFRTSHPLTQQDIDNSSVTNQAMVTSQPVGFEAQVIDLSDDNSLDENDQTVTMVPSDACPSEGTDPNFEIYTGITPNGDGINDFFRIDGIEAYPNNTLRIFNRWGALVYEAEGYGIGNEVFIGVSEGQATIMKDRSLPSGTYFYILEFETENPGEAAYSGYLYINRD